MSIEMLLPTAMVCDLQYLYAILASVIHAWDLYIFDVYHNCNCPHARFRCPLTHSSSVRQLVLKIRPVYTIPSALFRSTYRVWTETCLFNSTFCWQFFFSWEVVLHSPVSCFLRFRKSSIYTYDVISSFITASVYSIAIIFFLLSTTSRKALSSDRTQS